MKFAIAFALLCSSITVFAQNRDEQSEKAIIIAELSKIGIVPFENAINLSETSTAMARRYTPDVLKEYGLVSATKYSWVIKFATVSRDNRSEYNCYLHTDYNKREMVISDCTVTVDHNSNVVLMKTAL
jgi:hypothetical protein